MKRCRHCREPFEPKRSTLEKCCSPKCAIAYARQASPTRRAADCRKIRAAEKREAKERLRRRRDWVKIAQTEFNRFVTLRDAGKPCICCGRYPATSTVLRGHSMDAGHYRSVGAAPHLRFNEDNVHAQAVQCNRDKSGNAVEYRAGLIARIGLARVEALENDNAIRRFTIDELKVVITTYRAKAKALKAEREARVVAA